MQMNETTLFPQLELEPSKVQKINHAIDTDYLYTYLPTQQPVRHAAPKNSGPIAAKSTHLSQR